MSIQSKKLLLACIFLFYAGSIIAQDTTKSLAFRDNKPEKKSTLFYQPDLSYQIWQQFNLIKEANSGNALAQHELGLRYLLGERVTADTTLGAHWIKKAADQKLGAAAYNYGILLFNGWGINWDPFGAFNYFLVAANDNMPQAQHLIGILYTDNLITKRNMNSAYYWVKKSADAGYEPAIKTLEQLKTKVDISAIDTTAAKNFTANQNPPDNKNGSSNSKPITSSLGLMFIDFDLVVDSVYKKIETSTLLEDLALINDEKLTASLYISSENGKDSILSTDSIDLPLVLKYSENGSPEALTLLGKFYEEGIYFPKNIITASAYYIRAIRMDSPRAPMLMYELSKSGNYFSSLKENVNDNDPEGMYVWHGLVILGLDNRITEIDAFNLLQKSALQNYLPAAVELGLSHFTGEIVKEDKAKAIEIWKETAKAGSKEAKIRLETALLFSNQTEQDKFSFEELLKAAKNGSLLAQVSLAYCYETGIGTNKNFSEAAKYYRNAAQRGNQYAYKELQRLFDLIRPSDEIFQIN